MTFIEHLLNLKGGPNGRRALATLRRGLGKPPGSEPEMHRYVLAPQVAPARWEWEEDMRYLVAALFALHPENANDRRSNLGAHFAALCEGDSEPSPAVERRFNALLDSHPDDLYRTLQPAISLLKSKRVAVNWDQLLRDLQRWEDADQRRDVQRAWAKQFWSAFAKSQPEAPQPVSD